jgi:hypothetical protein
MGNTLNIKTIVYFQLLSMSYCLLILNCKKFSYKRDMQRNTWLKNFAVMPWFHVIGDTALDTEYKFDDVNNILYVNVPDDYLSLPKKTYMAIKAITDKFPLITHILKTDDDMDCNLTQLNKYLDIIYNYDYGGFFANVEANCMSTYHYKYCEEKCPYMILACRYCAGRFYFLSKLATDSILKKKDTFWSYVFEDNIVGHSLKDIETLKILEMEEKCIFKEFPQFESM